MAKYEFDAISGGDGECFCFFVDKETFIRLMGVDNYYMEIEYLRSWHNEIHSEPGSDPFTEPVEWPIYPHKFFDSGKSIRVKIEVEELPQKVIWTKNYIIN